MKNLKKLFSLCLVLALCLSLGTVALAAPVADATIDTTRTGALDIYKYDFTNAAKDGVWDSSYVSTGVYDQAVNDALGSAVRAGDTDNSSGLGNGEQSYGYAIKGVEFTYLRVADIVQFTESAADGSTSNHVEVLYGIDKTAGTGLLAAIGLADGAGRYENADNSDKLDHNKMIGHIELPQMSRKEMAYYQKSFGCVPEEEMTKKKKTQKCVTRFCPDCRKSPV